MPSSASAPTHRRYLGYVEGETSLIAPPIAGRLLERPVDRGGRVKKGDRLFVIDPVVAKAEVARAEAALAEAKARYENMLTGKRQEEQDVIRGQRREVEGVAGAGRGRAQAPERSFSNALTRHARPMTRPNAQVRQLRSRARVARRAGEASAISPRAPTRSTPAKALVVQNQANVDQARKQLDDLMPVAPEDALVENTFFNVGEWVPAGIACRLAAARPRA